MGFVERAAGIVCVALAMLLGGCASSTVRTTTVTPVIAGDPAMPEAQLLDVGVRLFASGADQLKEDELMTAPEIREAEARYMPGVLVQTMQKSGHWGAVRVTPERTAITDVVVDGRIIESTGLDLVLEITPSDASGATWYTRRYEGTASKFSYDARHAAGEPFQDVYNRIANDLAMYRAGLSAARVNELRMISELQFAESFSPQAFGGYLETDRKGITKIRRLPAENDPMLARVRQIRERDSLFVDTLQDYYNGFAQQMAAPYQDWRRESYTEGLAYKELRQQAAMRTVAGIAAIVGGIAMQGGDSASTRAAGTVGILGGAGMIKSGMDKRAEAKMHAETLLELGSSLGAEINPQVIELDERSVTLTGTVEQQYGQWREVLKGIYAEETGNL
ncbi:MAG: hypothetical protein IPF57_12650 [Gammaproteobacteria bacterium]|nr:hypothetical protein [Gammaproteobacteria bacterium]